LRDFFVIHPNMEKNLSRVFKIPSGFPGIALGKQVVKTSENYFFVILGKAVLEGGKWFSDPPWCGKCYWGGSEFTRWWHVSLSGFVCHTPFWLSDVRGGSDIWGKYGWVVNLQYSFILFFFVYFLFYLFFNFFFFYYLLYVLF